MANFIKVHINNKWSGWYSNCNLERAFELGLEGFSEAYDEPVTEVTIIND